MRRSVLLLPAVLLLGACSSGTLGSASPAVASSAGAPGAPSAPSSSGAAPSAGEDLVLDQQLTRTLYERLSSSSEAGVDALAAAQVAGNHPDYAYSVEECQVFLRDSGITDDFRLDAQPDVASMALDDGWALPDGRYAGLVPTGRVYALTVTFTESDVTGGAPQGQDTPVHVAVLDGEAFFFQPCE
ncbi:hypothetical protein [Modestobacter sp. Leaf380]|uniref:hypothetical protein n=1 Tax=Modestobacter sp. Leaf380 TaxID=1736356 RepID=UPI0006F970EA|nr:hypothetical protein [Modestobacter sp. Leaf380]KQS66239.1 hypothetical protein ASG41_13020 [Modestobacter sp. Leaf380]